MSDDVTQFSRHTHVRTISPHSRKQHLLFRCQDEIALSLARNKKFDIALKCSMEIFTASKQSPISITKKAILPSFFLSSTLPLFLLVLPFLTPSPALWARSTKNPDVSTGPLARPFAHSLAPLTRSLATRCSLRSRAPLRSLPSLPRSWDSE